MSKQGNFPQMTSAAYFVLNEAGSRKAMGIKQARMKTESITANGNNEVVAV